MKSNKLTFYTIIENDKLVKFFIEIDDDFIQN